MGSTESMMDRGSGLQSTKYKFWPRRFTMPILTIWTDCKTQSAGTRPMALFDPNSAKRTKSHKLGKMSFLSQKYSCWDTVLIERWWGQQTQLNDKIWGGHVTDRFYSFLTTWVSGNNMQIVCIPKALKWASDVLFFNRYFPIYTIWPILCLKNTEC